MEVIETDAVVDDGSAALLEIATPGGLTLRFPADVRPGQLAAVLAAISGGAGC